MTSDLAAPHLLPAEVANVPRLAVNAGEITDDVASIAHGDVPDLRVGLVSYETVAVRAWELRHHLTSYDVWSVAVAELLDTPLAALDQRLVKASGPTCAHSVAEIVRAGSNIASTEVSPVFCGSDHALRRHDRFHKTPAVAAVYRSAARSSTRRSPQPSTVSWR